MSPDNTLHGDGRAKKKSDILFHVEKATESRDGYLTYHVFSLKDVVDNLAISNPSGVFNLPF